MKTHIASFARSILLLLAPCVLGCRTGEAARTLRTDAPKSAEVLGDEQKCVLPADVSEPWVVDMQADRRVALEAALRGGPILVAYDCKELVLLQNCGIEGSYEYAGTTLVEDQLDLEDADAVAANLSGGSKLAVKLDAEMKRGVHLRIGYVAVGQLATTLARLPRNALPPQCKAATHFVARATLGAYAIERSSGAKMGAAAEIFSRGGKAESSSRDDRTNVVGDRNTCSAATSSDEDPLAKCAAPLKLMLVPIAHEDTPRQSTPDTGGIVVRASCPAGMVRRGELCVDPKRGGPSACKLGDVDDCTTQCKAGDAASCAALGFMYEEGKGAKVSPEKAREAYQRACEAGEPDGCAGLGFLYGRGAGVAVDKARSDSLLRPACERGSARACSGLGHEARLSGKTDEALRHLERGCKLGYARSCFYAGDVLAKSHGDEARMLDFHERACRGGDPRGCLASADMLASGRGKPANPAEADRRKAIAEGALSLACDDKDGEACEALADVYDGRYGVTNQNPAKALVYFERACSAGRWTSCRDAAGLLGKGGPGITKDPVKARRLRQEACKHGVASACEDAAKH